MNSTEIHTPTEVYVSANGILRTHDGRDVFQPPLAATVKVSMTDLERALEIVTGQTMRIADMWTTDYATGAEFVTRNAEPGDFSNIASTPRRVWGLRTRW